MSSISFSFLKGSIILCVIKKSYFLIPKLYAARHFSLMPPTGSTMPLREISPVITTSFLTFLLVIRETMAVAIVMPAEGPSFGMEAAGK